MTANWHDGAGVWVRYSHAFKSTPHRQARPYCVAPRLLDNICGEAVERLYGIHYDQMIIDDCINYVAPE